MYKSEINLLLEWKEESFFFCVLLIYIGNFAKYFTKAKKKQNIIFDSQNFERDNSNLTILIKTFYELKLI